MHRSAFAISLSVLAALPVCALAQSRTSVTLMVSPSTVHFERLGSPLGAFVAQARVTREFTSHAGAEVTAFTLMPTGAVSIMAGCLPGGTCESLETPNQINGGFGSVFVDVGESPLRVSAGYGRVHAVGGQGSGARSSGAYQVGLEWAPARRSGVQFTAGVRGLQLSDAIYGARRLLLPGVGISF